MKLTSRKEVNSLALTIDKIRDCLKDSEYYLDAAVTSDTKAALYFAIAGILIGMGVPHFEVQITGFDSAVIRILVAVEFASDESVQALEHFIHR